MTETRASEVPYTDVDIAYVPSDMGPDTVRWPSPVALVPPDGVWMVKPAPREGAWRLMYFDERSEVHVNVDLGASIGLEPSAPLIPVSLARSPDRSVYLVVARDFDHLEAQPRDYARVHLDPQGEVVRISSLQACEGALSVLVVPDGAVFSRSMSEGRWEWHRSDGDDDDRVIAVTEPQALAVNVGEFVLERAGSGTLRVLGEELTLQSVGGRSHGTTPIAGDGMFFGYVRMHSLRPDDGEQSAYVQPRELERLQLDPESRTVRLLGTEPLSPNRFGKDPAQPFVLFQEGCARFDADGNLFELAWREDRLRLEERRTEAR